MIHRTEFLERTPKIATIRLGVSLLILCISTCAASSSAAEVGLRKQLLVDDYVIAEMQNVTREVGRATKHGVVLKPTLPTDFQAGKVHDGPDGGPGYSFGESAFCWFFSPHWDSGKKKFRLWYMASKRPGSHLAYAESEDGIHWTKPLISKDGKSNLVNFNTPLALVGGKEARDLIDMGLDGVTVTIDPSLPYGSPEKHKVAFFPKYRRQRPDTPGLFGRRNPLELLQQGPSGDGSRRRFQPRRPARAASRYFSRSAENPAARLWRPRIKIPPSISMRVRCGVTTSTSS